MAAFFSRLFPGGTTITAAIPLRPTVTVYPLEAANEALAELQRGGTRGAKVLAVG